MAKVLLYETIYTTMRDIPKKSVLIDNGWHPIYRVFAHYGKDKNGKFVYLYRPLYRGLEVEIRF